MNSTERKRDAVFFIADCMDAAETAALAMQDHGLTNEQVETLAIALTEEIARCFKDVHDA